MLKKFSREFSVNRGFNKYFVENTMKIDRSILCWMGEEKSGENSGGFKMEVGNMFDFGWSKIN